MYAQAAIEPNPFWLLSGFAQDFIGRVWIYGKRLFEKIGRPFKEVF